MKRLVLMMLALGLFFSAQAVYSDWTPGKRLTWTSNASWVPDIAVDSNNAIHVVWQEGPDTRTEIYYKGSTDGGSTWSTAKRLTWTSGDSHHPAIAIDSNGHIYVVWVEGADIYWSKSTDGGATWSTAQELDQVVESFWYCYPAMAIDSTDTVHVVWGRIYGIHYTRSTDGGITWSGVQHLRSSDSVFSSRQSVCIDSNNQVHVVWYEDAGVSNDEIYYKGSPDGGTTWGATKRLTWTSVRSQDPAISIDSNGDIHVVWEEHYTPGNYEISFKKSLDEGVTWTPGKKLTWAEGYSSDPKMSIDSNNAVHVVWWDTASGVWETYYRRSTDGGTTWGARKRLSWNSGYSYHPAIDSNTVIHVVWDDNTPGNYEIYYRKYVNE